MNNIKLFSDSTCDLPQSEVERMDVGIVPLVVTFGDDVYKEGVEITPPELFAMVKERNMLPKTAAPSPADFYAAFKPYVDAGQKILYIGLSSKISTTLHNASLAAEFIGGDAITVVDSLNLCGAIGGLVRHAYNFIQEGFTLKETTDKIQGMAPHYKLFFTMNRLDYLHMGGRCSSMEYIFGNALNIKPIISMSAEGLDVWKKTRGKKKALGLMIDQAVEDKDDILFDEIHIACAVGNDEERSHLRQILTEKTGITKFHEYHTGCIISSHCGEGTIGFGYFLKH